MIGDDSDTDPMLSPDPAVRAAYLKEMMAKIEEEVATARAEARAPVKSVETQPVMLGHKGQSGGISTA